MGYRKATELLGLNWCGSGEMSAPTTIATFPSACPRKTMPNERSNRPPAENRAEETLCAFVVAKWRAEPLKTEQAMVLYARE